jgi:hypothetical protein
MSSLDFLGNLIASPIRDLMNCDRVDAPREPGAYILIATPGITFRYPRGESSVFYIGQTVRLRKRLRTHRKNILKANDQSQPVYRPVREYGAAYGAHYSFVVAGTEYTSRRLEDLLMARFARKYRSLPVANGAGGWKRIRQIIAAEGLAELQ